MLEYSQCVGNERTLNTYLRMEGLVRARFGSIPCHPCARVVRCVYLASCICAQGVSEVKPPMMRVSFASCICAQGVSEVKAKEWIRDEQLHTVGASEPLQMDARRGLKPQRQLVAAIAARLRLNFVPHVLAVEINGKPISITMYARSLEGVAAWFARFLTPEHCKARQIHNEDKHRVFGHPMWSDWAINEYGKPTRMISRP